MSFSGFNDQAWAQSRAPGAAFQNVAKEVAAATVSDKERALVQAAEDRIGEFTDQLTKLGDQKRWIDGVEAARAIQDPQSMVDTLAEIERDKASVPNLQAELDSAIVSEIRKMYPVSIRLLEAVIKRIDKELANIRTETIKTDQFWGLESVQSENWLVFGIQRLRSGLESNVESLRTGDPQQMSIARYVLSEAALIQPKARVQSP